MKKMINWAAVVMVALTMSIGCGDETMTLSPEDAKKMQDMSNAQTEGGSTMPETGEVADPESGEGGEEAADGGEEAAADGGEEAAAEASEEAAEGTE